MSTAELFFSGSYDILVIGAGPAGSSAARAAARMGCKVLLIEKNQRIGVPVQCAELVSKWVSHHASFTSGSIIQSIETMSIHLPNGTRYEMKSPGYMLDRSLFDKELATSAILSGAEVLTGAKALETSSEGVLIEQGSKKEWIGAKVIIGADGVHSTIAKWTKQPSTKVMVALQYEVALFEPQSHADIYFHPDYEGGYAWFFPKGRTANVGMGLLPLKTSMLPELLNRFLTLLKGCGKLPRIEVVSKTGGSIPCEPRQQTVFGNTMLVGDAAGHAHPITGAGILNAVLAGEIAGRIGAEAIRRGDLRYLENYESEWRETFGDPLLYGASKRNFLEEHRNKSEIDFERLIKKTWVGFKEYYKDRRITPP
ncbi:MAG: NAD(P)/FAD-dependent oxidoreductase [Deltaproteobacteria bacterium]|nr:NAD(P)/FAD-dependent oxidoreductase [Deltaproteobacteria bacterium]